MPILTQRIYDLSISGDEVITLFLPANDTARAWLIGTFDDDDCIHNQVGTVIDPDEKFAEEICLYALEDGLRVARNGIQRFLDSDGNLLPLP